MNTRYKILWIDDSPDFIDLTQELIEETVRQNNMTPELVIYSEYEEYQHRELDGFDKDIFNLYDQIIIDYALSGTTGEIIIRDLRRRNIFTDIVFYSSNYETMRDNLKQSDQLDGVFCASRENLTSAIDRVIKKNLKREYNIANIRGLIMDSTSDFDYICRTTTIALFEKLPPEKQQYIIDTAMEYVLETKQNSQSTFDTLCKKRGESFLKAVMESVDFVLSNKNRYEIMSLVVKEFDFDPAFGDSFAETYKNDLITPRNNLAHNKLYYGACQKKIHIAKKKEPLECDRNCESCKSKYSIETCEDLRKRIFHYYTLLNGLDEKADEIIGTK